MPQCFVSTSRNFREFGYCLAAMVVVCIALVSMAPLPLTAQAPTVVDENLAVRTVASGLTTPTMMVFLDDGEILVVEKNTGRVKHITEDGTSIVLDLAVNNASERGLLGITLDPDFEENGYVYLYWTCTADVPTDDEYTPTATECADEPSTGDDVSNVLGVPLLGNRVDRFVWDGDDGTLEWDLNLVKLRAFQNDGAPTPSGQGDGDQNPAGNHDGGVITFGTDGKLYIIIGDVGRRGQMQNLPSGPTETGLGTEVDDDQFGGPEPDDAHLTGVILRLNSDGTTPTDNPFYSIGASMGGEVGENIQMVYAYGIRNSFGMTVDPVSGKLWMSENGDNSFDELNLVEPGFNSGWIQIMGPSDRVDEYKAIETSDDFFGLQQQRWPPTRIADSEEDALDRLFMLPGAHFSDPEFSWKYAVAPAAIGFHTGTALGPQYSNDLFMGMSIPVPQGGVLLHFNLTGNRNSIGVDGDDLEDRVDDNTEPREFNESADMIFGTNFGTVTDIETGPNGNLYVVSLTKGSIFEIYSTQENNRGGNGNRGNNGNNGNRGNGNNGNGRGNIR